MRSNLRFRGVVAAAALALAAACSNSSDPGATGVGAGTPGSDSSTGFETSGGKDATTGSDASGGTDAATGQDGGGGGSDSGSGGSDSGSGDTGGGDTGGGTDQDTGGGGDTGGGDTGTTEDTAVGGCKEDKDCPAATAACKKAVCDKSTGACSAADDDDGKSCDDGNGCTVGDKCAKGACGGGAAKDCDDKQACTDDSCDPAAGCKNTPNTQQCNDNNECTTADVCKDGACSPGSAKVCDDGNPCTDDNCDKTKGCETTPNTATCDDGDACTTGEKCADGKCAGSSPVACDDKNPCTTDACDPKSGCTAAKAADGTSCDDGDACTLTDVCTAGACAGAAQSCDDKNPCTKDSCDKTKGGCVNANDDTLPCDDGNPCSTGDKCTAGKCDGVGKDCTDSNPCTDDGCKDSICVFTNNAAACDDGDACTQGDTCDGAGACKKSTPVVCDDKNSCTKDTCDKANGTCSFANTTDLCNDANACTTGDACKDGACAGTPKVCDDNKPCTIDSCDNASGNCSASNAADGTSCDDGTVCTQNDACATGACKGSDVKCDDGNACTTDACDAVKGCTATNNTAPCDDGDACTTADACKDGKCGGGPAKVCDDKNACTNDSCDKASGCVHANNTATCSDSDACTDADACKNGACAGQIKKCDDGKLCTDDSCDKATGCKYANNTALCTDGSICTTADACKGGVCVGASPMVCDDKNPCTTDSCDAKLGCQYKAAVDGGQCDDGNGCTVNDACKAGKCLGAGKNCDDNNICTTDTCAADVCAYANNKNPCNDNSICTLVDTCDGNKKCVGSTPLPCNDQNPCTTDTCDPIKGCVFTVNTLACNDGLYCTKGDTCALGLCKSATPTCDDGNVCTNDTCDEAADKCGTVVNTADCNDGDLCTPGDKCSAGTCKPGKPIVCDDVNPCTVDSCDKVSGKCMFKLTTDVKVCPLHALPKWWPIDYADPLWFGASNSASVKWRTDKTPAVPGAITGLASLNFNNGTDYADATVGSPAGRVTGKATGAFFVDATKVTGSFMTFAILSYNGVEADNGYDSRTIEFSTDGFATIAVSSKLDNTKNQNAWVIETVNLKALIGKSFQVRFSFDSIDGTENNGKGWFVDHANIYLGPEVMVTPASLHVDPFDSNVNGWQFETPVAGSAWAIDNLPAIAPHSPGLVNGNTLNFNNGKDFAGTVNGTTISPVVNLEGVPAGPVTLLWREWIDTEALSFADKRYVEVSGDAFATLPVGSQLVTTSAMLGGWRWQWVDLSALKGKKFRVRFRFDSFDATNNSGKGWAIDDIQLAAAQAPSFGDMITCANASNWTIANGAGPGWAVDAAGDIPAWSPDCSLNFNNAKANASGKFDYKCAANATKAHGKATSPVFTVQAPVAGQKAWLQFKAYADIETLAGYDVLRVQVRDIGANKTTDFAVDKTAIYKKWNDVAIDLSPWHAKPVTVTFWFDSTDCGVNDTAGVFIDNVMVRAK